jgi:hypothetical protein
MATSALYENVGWRLARYRRRGARGTEAGSSEKAGAPTNPGQLSMRLRTKQVLAFTRDSFDQAEKRQPPNLFSAYAHQEKYHLSRLLFVPKRIIEPFLWKESL